MAKTARSKEEPIADSSPESSVEALQSTPTQEQIAARAYQIYLERGETQGDPMSDWLQAERELTEAFE